MPTSTTCASCRPNFPNLKVIKLEQNYRSTVRILKAANNVIANNEKLFDKKLWSEHGHGEPISVTTYRDNDAEAEGVVMKLQAHRFEQRTQFKDYAILYRSNHQARMFEEYLRDHRIPYLLSGGKSFFDKAEIKDITAYLRLLANEDDDPAFIRAATTPKRGIGAATLQALGTYAGERHVSLFAAAFEEGFAHRVAPRQLEPLLEFGQFINRMQERAGREPADLVLPDLLKAIDYETYLYDHEEERVAQTRWANVCEFANWINKKGELDGKTLIELTQSIALINMLDKQNDEEVDAVQLSTLHASKGLEYPPRFPGRRRGRHPAAPRIDRAEQGGGGAPPDVRRHHARSAHPAYLFLRTAQAGAGVHSLRTVALHRRNGARRRALCRRQGSQAAGQGDRQRPARCPEGDARWQQGLTAHSSGCRHEHGRTGVYATRGLATPSDNRC